MIKLDLFRNFLMNGEIVVLLDWLSVIFISVVIFISRIVMIYRKRYIKDEIRKVGFCYLVIFFVMRILFMILFSNMWLIIIGWDGLGLVSYCLVIYYKRDSSSIAGMITVIRNRVGDLGILIRIVFFVNFGSWDILYFNLRSRGINLICIMLILGAITKRAQVPFSAWLPIAMAAPTPVSSLVHSSTLVTAGVYLLLRFNLYFEGGGFFIFLFFVGLFTMLVARIGALLEIDLKKIIALSTLSQLGFMIITLSIGMWKLTFFHLIVHAVFKAMLFLCAGLFIHEMNGNQDIRKLMCSVIVNKNIKMMLFIGNLSIIGFPFMGGYYSKDLILEIFYFNENYLVFFYFFLLGVILTVLYSLRLIYYVFWRNILLRRCFFF